jgi:hypothetical protein
MSAGSSVREDVELAQTEVVTVDCREVIEFTNQRILKSD